MENKKFKFHISLGILLSILVLQINAAIIYEKDGSPHYIKEDIIIENNDSIIIEKGAILIISPNVDIITNGVIIANGIEEDPISILPEIEGVGWGRIEIVSPNKTSIFNHVMIVDGSIKSRYCDITLDNVTFINNQELAWNNPVVFVIDASVNIVYSSIYGSYKGEGFQMLNSENVLVKNCFFSKIPDAVELTNITGGYVSNNWFDDIPDDGIDLNNCTNTIIDSNIIINAVDRGIELGSENNGNSENIIVRRNVLIGCGVGVILKEESSGQLINNTFFGNTVGVKCIEDNGSRTGSSMTVQNCIFSNSTESDFVKDMNSTLTIDFSISDTEVLEGNNNVFSDPMFVNAAEYDFHLLEDSPCINAGNPELPLDPDQTISDIGAFYYNTDTTGIHDNHEVFKSLTVSPNPFLNDFTVSFDSKYQITISLYSLNGKKIPAILEKNQLDDKNNIRVIPTSNLKSNKLIICDVSIDNYSVSYLLYHR
jgi:parallel beta-helix repeat protein